MEHFNPYRPGAGTQPPALVGRQAEVDRLDLMVGHARNGRNDGGLFLHGLRGVGKTVLLQKLREIGESAGWLTVSLEARPGAGGAEFARQRLGRGVALAARKMRGFRSAMNDVQTALRTVSSFAISVAGVSVDMSVEPAPYRANSGNLEIDFEELISDLAPVLLKNRSALAIFVDEMQDLDEPLLIALAAAQHRAMQLGIPFYLIGAGLPTLLSVLARARSYTERFETRRIGPLTRSEATDALVTPSTRLGLELDQDAVDLLLDEAAGYPFFLQSYGYEMWEAAPTKHVDVEVARSAIEAGNRALDDGFFIARWDRTTAAERQYLRAIAEVGGASAGTRAIAEHLGREPKAFGPVRSDLIDKGIIFPERRGVVSFTVPNMQSFIARHPDGDD